MIVHFQDPEKHILDNFCAFFEQKIMEIHRMLGASVHTIAELYFTIEFIFSKIVIKYNCPISMAFLKKSTRSCTEMYFLSQKVWQMNMKSEFFQLIWMYPCRNKLVRFFKHIYFVFSRNMRARSDF